MEPTLIAAIVAAVGTAIVGIIGAFKKRSQNKKDQLDHEENLVKLSSSMSDFNQNINGLRTEIMQMLNGISKDMDRLDRKLEDFHSEWKGYNIVMLRHDITSVYQHYKAAASIPQNVYQSTMELFDKYEKLGGNSYVKEIVEEMKTWEKV